MLLENKESGKLIEQAHPADSRLAGFLIDKSPAHALSLSLWRTSASCLSIIDNLEV